MNVDYNDIAAEYDKHRSYSDRDIKRIIVFSGIGEGMRVLDLGCGTGNISSRLRQIADVDVLGVDRSLNMLRVATGKSLGVLCADANCRLPFRDSIFDKVITAYVIHQITNLTTMFSECYRVLRKGSIIILTSSHRQIETVHPVFGRFFPGAVEIDKARFPDIPVVDEYLTGAGFTHIRHDKLVVSKIPLDDEYLHKIKEKYVSTYRLIPQEEYDRGVTRLEAFIRNGPRVKTVNWQGTLIRAEKDG